MTAAAETTPSGSPQLVFNRILDSFASHHPDESTASIERAFGLAVELHAGQTRKTGEPFIFHPLEVARLLADYGLDADTLVAAILHDAVEDTSMTLERVQEGFGAGVAALIDGVTKLDRLRFRTPEEHQAATIRKMVLAMAKDVRVLLIKLADRLHNVRTISPLPVDKQQRIASETLEVYAPLAHRLGVQDIKHEMEDRCFEVLHPRKASELAALVRKRAPARERVLGEVSDRLATALAEAGVKAEVSGRPKHMYSIYRKMVDAGRTFEEIHDLMGLRVITQDVRDAYGALGVVHTLWAPVHGRFKDYIATPKFNLYQSIHTTVVGPGGKPLEIQIRTQEMHHRAEYGVAAHWRYKEGTAPDSGWLLDMDVLQSSYPDPADFLANLKIELYRDEVFAITPKGDVITLPRGATPLDFAYLIHTEVGHRCVGSKVNGRLVPLATPLRSGDIVEIITSRAPHAGPSRDWLQVVSTSRAASKIRQWFNRERRTEALGEGRDALSKAISKEGLSVSLAESQHTLSQIAHSLGYSDLEAMVAAVGEGGLAAQSVAGRLRRLLAPAQVIHPSPRVPKTDSAQVLVEGRADMLARLARCCTPVPGDEIVGFVTIGRGVSVHRSDCTNLGTMSRSTHRMVEVAWATITGAYTVWIQVEALDRPNLLRDITALLSEQGVNINASSTVTAKDRSAVLRFEVEFSDPSQLERTLSSFKAVEGVYDAFRLASIGSSNQ